MDQPESYKFCKLTLSLSLSLSLSGKLFRFINMTRLFSSYKLFPLTLLEKWYRTGGNRMRFDPHLTWNTCICYGHSLLPLLQDWQLQVSGGSAFSVLVKRLFYKHDPSLLARFVKNAVPHPVTPHLPGYKWILLCYSLTVYTLITLSLLAYRAIFKTFVSM